MHCEQQTGGCEECCGEAEVPERSAGQARPCEDDGDESCLLKPGDPLPGMAKLRQQPERQDDAEDRAPAGVEHDVPVLVDDAGEAVNEVDEAEVEGEERQGGDERGGEERVRAAGAARGGCRGSGGGWRAGHRAALATTSALPHEGEVPPATSRRGLPRVQPFMMLPTRTT